MEDFSPEALAKRIRQLRTERGMSRLQFAKLVGSSTGSNICWWENAERTPSAYYCFQIAKSCGVSADWLLGLTEDRREAKHEH